MLTMVDSTGNTGGISPTLYNITNGKSNYVHRIRLVDRAVVFQLPVAVV